MMVRSDATLVLITNMICDECRQGRAHRNACQLRPYEGLIFGRTEAGDLSWRSVRFGPNAQLRRPALHETATATAVYAEYARRVQLMGPNNTWDGQHYSSGGRHFIAPDIGGLVTEVDRDTGIERAIRGLGGHPLFVGPNQLRVAVRAQILRGDDRD